MGRCTLPGVAPRFASTPLDPTLLTRPLNSPDLSTFIPCRRPALTDHSPHPRSHSIRVEWCAAADAWPGSTSSSRAHAARPHQQPPRPAASLADPRPQGGRPTTTRVHRPGVLKTRGWRIDANPNLKGNLNPNLKGNLNPTLTPTPTPTQPLLLPNPYPLTPNPYSNRRRPGVPSRGPPGASSGTPRQAARRHPRRCQAAFRSRLPGPRRPPEHYPS